MKKRLLLLVPLLFSFGTCKTLSKKSSYKLKNTAKIDSTIVKKHLYTLASDEMEGRKTGTKGIEKAAQYIEAEFKRMGLTTFDTLQSYRQTFTFSPENSNDSITASNIIRDKDTPTHVVDQLPRGKPTRYSKETILNISRQAFGS